jgi:hypothetical protein
VSPSRPTYSHRLPYPKAADRPRATHRLSHTERLLKNAFLASYQALADTFRSDLFTANINPTLDGQDRLHDLVWRYVESAGDRARESFMRILVPVANAGAVSGQEQADRSLRRRFRKAGVNSNSVAEVVPYYQYIGPSPKPAATVTPLYPGSIPAWVPPRRKLLRIPKPRINIRPGRRDFSSAPQVHLDAVQQLPLDLVQLIDESQIGGIRMALDESIRRGYDADMLGQMIANMVGLFPRWQQAVINLGDRMRDSGKHTEKEIAYRQARYSDALREKRGIMIARTEMMTATNTGRMDGWRQQEAQGYLDGALSEKEWLAAPGACPQCAALNGQTVKGINGEFNAGTFGMVKGGPCHPSCRCVILIHPVRNPDQYLDPQ